MLGLVPWLYSGGRIREMKGMFRIGGRWFMSITESLISDWQFYIDLWDVLGGDNLMMNPLPCRSLSEPNTSEDWVLNACKSSVPCQHAGYCSYKRQINNLKYPNDISKGVVTSVSWKPSLSRGAGDVPEASFLMEEPSLFCVAGMIRSWPDVENLWIWITNLLAIPTLYILLWYFASLYFAFQKDKSSRC